MLELSIHPLVKFVLVRPHYPENVGAAARAMKTMGFTRLVLVKPGKMAEPSHVMAVKMAVKSLDVLEASPRLQRADGWETHANEAPVRGGDGVFGRSLRLSAPGRLRLRKRSSPSRAREGRATGSSPPLRARRFARGQTAGRRRGALPRG